jgi:hypothetical protein
LFQNEQPRLYGASSTASEWNSIKHTFDEICSPPTSATIAPLSNMYSGAQAAAAVAAFNNGGNMNVQSVRLENFLEK